MFTICIPACAILMMYLSSLNMFILPRASSEMRGWVTKYRSLTFAVVVLSTGAVSSPGVNVSSRAATLDVRHNGYKIFSFLLMAKASVCPRPFHNKLYYKTRSLGSIAISGHISCLMLIWCRFFLPYLLLQDHIHLMISKNSRKCLS